MTTTTTTTVRMPAAWIWLLRLGLPAIGFGLAFAVKPLFDWLISVFDSAPGPLRVAAELPLHWAILALTVLGLIAGVLLAEAAKHDALTLTVDDGQVLAEQKGEQRYLARDQVSGVFFDRKALVFVDDTGRELYRGDAADLPKGDVVQAFEQHGYPWRGEDSREFATWVDGRPELDDELHALLRARGRALKDKKSGEAAGVLDQLQDRGLVVRDRDGKQQYHRLSR